MDKHIMEPAKSRTKDFFNSFKPHDQRDDEEEEEEEDDDDDDDRSCDFQFHPFRSFGALHSYPSTLKYSDFMDRMDSVEVAHHKVGISYEREIIVEIDRTMKELSDNLLHVMESVNVRLSQLESKTCHVENAVDELKVSAEYNHGRTSGKLRQLENILREVQDVVRYMRDKQEIVETQLQLAKLQGLKSKSQSEEQRYVVQTDSVRQASISVSQQSYPSFPISSSLPVAHSRISLNASSTFPNQNLQPAAAAVAFQFPGQLTQSQIPSSSPVSYHPVVGQSPGITVQQSYMPPHQQLQPPSPVPQPSHVSQLSQLPQPHSPIGAVAPENNTVLSHRPAETPYMSSYSYSPSIPQSSSQPAEGSFTQEFHLSSTQQMHGQPFWSANSEILVNYAPGPANYGNMHPYSESSSLYGSSTMKHLQHPPLPSVAGGGSNYTRPPEAQLLPHALPIASSLDGGSTSEGIRNKVPMGDVVEKVTAMGFRRDMVRAIVTKLTEHGQSVDLDVVLDKLMNTGGLQPQ